MLTDVIVAQRQKKVALTMTAYTEKTGEVSWVTAMIPVDHRNKEEVEKPSL